MVSDPDPGPVFTAPDPKFGSLFFSLDPDQTPDPVFTHIAQASLIRIRRKGLFFTLSMLET